MKTAIKIIWKSAILLAFAFILLDQLSLLFRPEKFNQGNNFRGFEKNTFDTIVLGSSHAQYSFNPAVYYKKTGNYSYVLGSACQAIPVSFEFLEESLKTQKPEVVLLEVFTMLPSSSVCKSDGVIKLASEQMTGINKYRSILYVEERDKVLLDYWFDIRMHHSRWNEMKCYELTLPQNYVNDFYMGHVTERPNTYNKWQYESLTRKEQYKLDERDIEYLLKIKDLCDKNDIDLILYKAPFVIDQENYDALHAVWDLAKENSIDFVDFFKLQKNIDFNLGMDGDAWHNNVWGARKITEYLSSYVEANYQIQHHRTARLQEENLVSLQDVSVQNFLQDMIDPYQFLSIAANYDCTILIHYQGYPSTTIGQVENELLQNLGFSHNFVENHAQDYFAITKNQHRVLESEEEIIYSEKENMIEINKEGIMINGKIINTDSEMTIVVLSNEFNWYEVMNIDYFSKFFWKKGYNGWDRQ